MTQQEIGARLRVLEEGPVVFLLSRNREIPDREPAAPEEDVSGHRVGQEVPVPGEVARVAIAGPEQTVS